MMPKPLTLILLVILTILPIFIQSPAGAVEASQAGFTIHELHNGMRVVLQEVHAYPAVHFNTWIGVGSRDERPQEYGISHFLEHMIFNGNSRYNRKEMDDALYSIGAVDNGTTSYDHTHYQTTVPSNHFTLGLDIHCKMIMEPSLSEESYFTERDVVKEEVRMRDDRPGTVVWETAFNNAFDYNGYSHPIIGTMEALDGMTVEMLRDYHRRYYYPANMVLIVAGDFDSDKALEQITKEFGKYENPVSKRDKTRAQIDTQNAPRMYDLRRDVSGCYLEAVFKATSMNSPETCALDILMTILGDGDSSRLAKRLKGELSLAKSIGAYNYSLLDASSLGIYAEYSNPDDSGKILSETLSILDRFKEEGPTALELEKAKRRIISSRVFASEKLDGLTEYLGYFILHGGVDMALTYLDRINSVTPEQLRELARRYLSRDNITLAGLRPENSAPLEPNWDGLSIFKVNRADFDFGSMTNPLPFHIGAGGQTQGGIEHTTLANGLDIWFRYNPANPTIAIDIYTEGGLAWESKSTNGICQVLQKSLMQGTTSRTRDELNEELDYLGGSISVDAYRDFMAVESIFLASDFEKGFDLLADVTGSPLLSDDGIEKAREEVTGGVTAEADDMYRVAFDELRKRIYGEEHPYGRPYKGTVESLKGIPADEVRDLYKKAYEPQNMHLVAAGDITFDRLVATAEKYFGMKGHGNDFPPDVASVKEVANPGETKVPREKAQLMIAIGRPTVNIYSDEMPAMLLMNIILGGSSYSRIYQDVRVKRGYAYSVFSFQQTGRAEALWACYLGTKPENYPAVIQVIYDTIEKMGTDGVSSEEIQKAKDYTRGITLMGHIGNKALAFQIGQNVVVGLEPDHEFKVLDAIANLTSDDIIKTLKEYLDPDKFAVVVAGKV